MNTLRSSGLVFIATCALGACSAPHDTDPATAASTVPAAASAPQAVTAPPPPAPISADAGLGFEPNAACHFLSSNPMFTQGGDYTPFIDDTVDDYACGTTYFQLGQPSGDSLANNISFYGRGTAKTVKRVNLLLNVNNAGTFPEANQAFRSAAVQLFKAALKKEPDPKVGQALKTSTPGAWQVGDYKVELLRDDWKTGRGYSLNFVIGAPTFNAGF